MQSVLCRLKRHPLNNRLLMKVQKARKRSSFDKRKVIMVHRLIEIDDYEQFVGAETIARIREKAKPLQGSHVVHVNSTYQGGGVATLLDSLTLLMIGLGIKTGWRAIQSAADFFTI